MIPKIIHYCWFGHAPKNYMAKKCIKSYSILKNDIKVIEWNEHNSDLEATNYVAQAYKNKAWAFVSDYIRLKALYDFGGIYLDTDVEIKKEFEDSFFKADLILGYMYDDIISTAVIMAKPKHPFIKKLLDEYNFMDFKSTIPNNELITQELLNYYP